MILGIYGTGGTGREVFNIIMSYPSLKEKWEKVLYIDDTISAGSLDGTEVYPLEEIIKNFDINGMQVCIAVGEPEVKKILLDKINNAGIKLATIIHPDAFISSDAVLGEGIIVKKGAIVSSKANIGNNTCLQAYSVIGHDVIVGDNCQISTFVAIGGFAKIGENTYIGLNSAIRDRVTIGKNTIISMGSVVQRDIPDCVIAMGNPARPMRKNEEGRVFK